MSTVSMDLKVRLARRVVLLALCCLGVASVSLLISSDRAARAKANTIVEVIRSAFEIQQGKERWIRGTGSLPDLQTLAAAVMESGVCIGYRTGADQPPEGICAGVDPQDSQVPRWFSRSYSQLFGARRESVRTLASKTGAPIEVSASIDPQKVIGQSWRDISRIFLTLAATLSGLCILVYLSFAEFLRPTRLIRKGLARLATGDLTTRLPAFDLAELSAVGTVFNTLACNLERSLAERTALTQRLIAVQDEERRHLARELHDEFGQCLAGIAAVAESAGQTAREQLPGLLPECQSIARTAAHMMDVLRSALFRLRPAEIDDMGLAASLHSLVSGWNARSPGTRYCLELTGCLDSLPPEFSLNIYRVAQEGLTNAAKHSHASTVTLRLGLQTGHTAGPCRMVELIVEDDGRAPRELPPRAGMGLVGMRERISALYGSLSIEASRVGGLILRALIPVPQADETPGGVP